MSLDELRKNIILAIFSDFELSETFILKGGSAIDIVHQIGSGRSSKDIDLAMENSIPDEILTKFELLFKHAIDKQFKPIGYIINTCNFKKVPLNPKSEKLVGYNFKFSLTEIKNETKVKSRSSENHIKGIGKINIGGLDTFTIEMSGHDIWDPSYVIQDIDLENLEIKVYRLEAIVCEKTRAICQKVKFNYFRSKDIYDICIILEKKSGWDYEEIAKNIKLCFDKKEVDLDLIEKIFEFRNDFKIDFEQKVNITIPFDKRDREFDYYFDEFSEFIKKVMPFIE